MSRSPSLRDLVRLPDFYTFKIIVKPERIGGDQLLSLTRNHLGRDLRGPELKLRPSAKGNFGAFTLKLHIESFKELECLYRAYREHEGVVMVL